MRKLFSDVRDVAGCVGLAVAIGGGWRNLRMPDRAQWKAFGRDTAAILKDLLTQR